MLLGPRQPLAIAGLFVSACPDGHGAWLSPDVAESLRALVGTRAVTVRRQRRLLLGLLAGLALVLGVVLTTQPGQQSVAMVTHAVNDRIENTRLSETHWPERRWPGAHPIPVKESRIDVHEELLYFDQLLAVLAMGISNRLNMEGVLAVNRAPERYLAPARDLPAAPGRGARSAPRAPAASPPAAGAVQASTSRAPVRCRYSRPASARRIPWARFLAR